MGFKTHIKFPQSAKRLYHTVESYAWKRCAPRPDEFRRYLHKHNLLQRRAIAPDLERLRRATNVVRTILRPFRMEPISLIKSFWNLKKNTSAGLAFDDEDGVFRKLFSTKDETPFWIVKRDVRRWKVLGRIDTPTAIAFRSHLARGENHKSRVVFVYPYSVCALEGKYAIPLLDMLKNSAYSCPYGTQHRWLQGGFRHLKSFLRNGIPMSLDFSGFDLSVKEYLIRIAFGVLRECFHLSTTDEAEWDLFVEYFINTIVRNGGEDLVLHGGVPSGSVWTHLIGTTISLILAHYCVPDLLAVKAFGDDLIIMANREMDMLEIIKHARNLGLDISEEKSVIGELHWLGFDISGDYPRILDVIKRWASFFHPERPDESMAHFKGRLLGFAMSSLDDPSFRNDLMTIWSELEDHECILSDHYLAPEFRGVNIRDITTLQRVFRNVI